MAQENKEAGPSNTNENSLDDSFGLTSKSFDPLRVIYASSLGHQDENVEIFESVSQFIENVQIDSSPQVPSAFPFSCEDKEPAVSNPERQESEIAIGSGTTYFAATETEAESKSVAGKNSLQHESKHSVDLCQRSNEKSETEQISVASPPNQSKLVDDSQAGGGQAVPTMQSRESTLTYRKRRERRTVLTEMKTGFNQGPLNLLKRSVEEKIKVRVWTRSVRNIRGISTGYVVAFDKHMNLAMMDVDEVYRKPVGKHKKKSKNPKVGETAPEETAQDDQADELCYPNTPWQPQGPRKSETQGAVIRPSDRGGGDMPVPADGIGNLPSKFSGMHVFEECEASRLLGTKARRLLSRHLNQVLLRGEHVVAVALVDTPPV